MKKIYLILILLISISSCKSSKRAKERKAPSYKEISKSKHHKNDASTLKITKSNSKNKKKSSKSKASNIINYAKRFKGVRYKWGGTTKSGMDCSGLIYTSYQAYNITLPRISRDIAKKGKKISLKHVQGGDLLFFKTGNRRNNINHVGLVIKSKSGVIEFIHATSGKGVIISKLSEKYWKSAFFEARKIL